MVLTLLRKHRCLTLLAKCLAVKLAKVIQPNFSALIGFSRSPAGLLERVNTGTVPAKADSDKGGLQAADYQGLCGI